MNDTGSTDANPTSGARTTRRILRSRSDRILGGVAGGFADYLNVDPVLIRLAFVALTLVGGVGAVLYLVGWLIIPEPADPGEVPEPGEPTGPRSRSLRAKPMVPVWIGILLLVGLVLAGGFRHVGFGIAGGVLWPIVLILFGAAVLWSRAGSGRPPANRPEPPPGTGTEGTPTAAPTAEHAPATGAVVVAEAAGHESTGHESTDDEPTGDEPAVGQVAPVDPDDPRTTAGMELALLPSPGAEPPTEPMVAPTQPMAAPAAPPRVAVRPSPIRRAAPVLGRVILALFGAAVAFVVTVGAVLLFEGRDVFTVTSTQAVVASIVLVGLAVALGLLWGRVPDLLVVTAAVVLVLGVAAWLRPPLRGGIGDQEVRPADAAALAPKYELAAGRLRIDLRAVEPTARHRSVAASVAFGVIEIVVPDDVTVHFRGRVSAGQVCAFGHRDSGTGNDVRSTRPGPAGAPVLNVDARVGVGEVHVGRTAAEAADRCSVSAAGLPTVIGAPAATPVPTVPAVPALSR